MLFRLFGGDGGGSFSGMNAALGGLWTRRYEDEDLMRM